ncbi:MAG: site-specific DNA-methyltransferase [Planctomycetes bacterium]|nr:site-specific DNA-methyltransferase [Planctomycetota bacterium]
MSQNRDGGRVIHGTCEDLSALGDGEVTLTVTSPPYWNAIDYDRHAVDSTQWYRTRRYADAGRGYEEYLAKMTGIFSGVLAKTRPGGFLAVVIGTLLLDGKHFPVPFDLTSRLVQSGWRFHQDIIWNKVTGGVKRAGVFIQKPFPGYYYPNIMTEYILLFRRDGEPLYRGRSRKDMEAARNPINQLFTCDIANSVWHVAPVPPGHIDHPCPFPEEIPARLASLYSYPGDLVLDPFCGSGQTLKVARALGRRHAGYDVVEKYVDLSRARLDEPLALRAEQLAPRMDKIAIGAALRGPGRAVVKRRPNRRSPSKQMFG